MQSVSNSILDHPAISGRYQFPQKRYVDDPFIVECDGARLACHRKVVDPDNLTIMHFHDNSEFIADYVSCMADLFAELDLNYLFVEYREYGCSTGSAQLVALLGDGERVMKVAALKPKKVIVFGRSLGSL